MKEVQAVVLVTAYALLASLDTFAASPTELAVRGPVDDLSAFINVLSACTSPSGDALEAFGVLAKKSSSILALSGPVGAVAAFAIHTVFTKPDDNATLFAYQNRTLFEFTRLGQMVNQTRREVKFDSMFSQYLLHVVDGTELLEMDIIEVVLNATIVDRRPLGRDFVERCRGTGRTYFVWDALMFMRTRLVTQCRIPTAHELRLMVDVQSLLGKYDLRYANEQHEVFYMRMRLALFVSSLDSEESEDALKKLQDELSRYEYLSVEYLGRIMNELGVYNRDINECMLTATVAAYSSLRLPLFQVIDIIRDDIGRLLEINAYCLNATYDGHRESMEVTNNRIKRAVLEIIDYVTRWTKSTLEKWWPHTAIRKIEDAIGPDDITMYFWEHAAKCIVKNLPLYGTGTNNVADHDYQVAVVGPEHTVPNELYYMCPEESCLPKLGFRNANFFITRQLRSTAATRVASAFEFKQDYKDNITRILKEKYDWQLDDLRYEIEDVLGVRLTDPSRFNTAVFVRDTKFWDGCRVLYQNYWVQAGFPPLTCATTMSKLVPDTWCYDNAIFFML
ncbi:hypothetical protein AAVH_09117 [Aphelenchoides avenae]|nr:hypothetical protein AAVH_09117 [Aphelenchus avenae]